MSARLYLAGDVVRVDAAGGFETTVRYDQREGSVAVIVEPPPWDYYISSSVRADALTLVRAVDAPTPRRMQANSAWTSISYHGSQHEESEICGKLGCSVLVDPAKSKPYPCDADCVQIKAGDIYTIRRGDGSVARNLAVTDFLASDVFGTILNVERDPRNEAVR